MNVDNCIGLNAPNDVGIYLSVEDIEAAETWTDQYDNKLTILHMKSGKILQVLGDAYHILNLNKK